MKRITNIFLLVYLFIGCSTSKVSYVFDQDRLFTEEQIEKLNQLIREHEKKTSNEIAVLCSSYWNEHEGIFFITQ